MEDKSQNSSLENSSDSSEYQKLAIKVFPKMTRYGKGWLDFPNWLAGKHWVYYNTNNHLEWCRKSNQRGFSEIYISRFKVGNGRILVRNMRKTGRVQCLGWLVTRPPVEAAARHRMRMLAQLKTQCQDLAGLNLQQPDKLVCSKRRNTPILFTFIKTQSGKIKQILKHQIDPRTLNKQTFAFPVRISGLL